MIDKEIVKTENGLTPFEEKSAFLAQLYGDAVGLTGSFAEMPYAQDAFLLGTNVAGTSHVENIQELFTGLSEGDRVILVREPENEHDNRSIRIETESGDKLGYVPHTYNLILSRLMDAGYYLYGKVRLLEIQNERYYYIVVKIYISFSEYGIRNDKLLRMSEDEDDQKNYCQGSLQKLNDKDRIISYSGSLPAEELYMQAVELDGNGLYEEAEKKVRAAITMGPDESRYHNLLGIILVHLSNFRQSAEEFRTAFSLDSNNVYPLFNIAMLSHARGENVAAVKMLDAALPLTPDASDILFARSVIMFSNPKPFFAVYGKDKVKQIIIEGLQHALKSHPDNPKYRELLATASLRFGKSYKVSYTINFKK